MHQQLNSSCMCVTQAPRGQWNLMIRLPTEAGRETLEAQGPVAFGTEHPLFETNFSIWFSSIQSNKCVLCAS